MRQSGCCTNPPHGSKIQDTPRGVGACYSNSPSPSLSYSACSPSTLYSTQPSCLPATPSSCSLTRPSTTGSPILSSSSAYPQESASSAVCSFERMHQSHISRSPLLFPCSSSFGQPASCCFSSSSPGIWRPTVSSTARQTGRQHHSFLFVTGCPAYYR